MIDAFTKAGSKVGIAHHQRTAYWASQLKPDISEALMIAAITHDIERAFNGDWKAGSSDPKKLRKHQDLCAEEVEKFLKKLKANKNLISRVKTLIAHHEEGGDEEQNILCDADCLTYLENVAFRHARTYLEKGMTKEEMKQKLEYVYGRISSDKAKELGQRWHKKALDELENS